MSDNDYFRRRAVEELAAAEWAACPEAKGAHRDLATRYMTLLNLHAEATAPPAREGPLSAY